MKQLDLRVPRRLRWACSWMAGHLGTRLAASHRMSPSRGAGFSRRSEKPGKQSAVERSSAARPPAEAGSTCERPMRRLMPTLSARSARLRAQINSMVAHHRLGEAMIAFSHEYGYLLQDFEHPEGAGDGFGA